MYAVNIPLHFYRVYDGLVELLEIQGFFNLLVQSMEYIYVNILA